ncbi:MAG: adenylyltransferase/cytidyltransferase family protein [Vampirovibrionales bacterium]
MLGGNPTDNRSEYLVDTNGCFDLLPHWPCALLQEARRHGDALIVALNTDASVHELKPQEKGPSRPVVPQEERAELLAALRCVDAVVLFDTPTPEAFLKALRPNIHVKGAQYTPETLPEWPLLQSLHTQLVLAPMIAGQSTSALIAKIRG